MFFMYEKKTDSATGMIDRKYFSKIETWEDSQFNKTEWK